MIYLFVLVYSKEENIHVDDDENMEEIVQHQGQEINNKKSGMFGECSCNSKFHYFLGNLLYMQISRW